MRLDLPDNVVGGSSVSTTGIASMEVDQGFNQLYGEDEPLAIANITFRTTEPNPTINTNFQGSVLWSRVTFNMDDIQDGDFMLREGTRSTSLAPS
ncbi:hypothetical protein IV203_038429 [Nitzschia inconspicua]|uniref:Uncharacterized protein n=1 Tax=Nitzschia inconspicua TaxID=303405 RepID=A0A9K3LQT4_9STRA|nr:hypothetical protein IV203_038429 [Nitzschia inconspicua]